METASRSPRLPIRAWLSNAQEIIIHINRKITPCLWFDDKAEEAAGFYNCGFQKFQDRSHYALRKSRIRGSQEASGLR
jgi:hypothetical protein